MCWEKWNRACTTYCIPGLLAILSFITCQYIKPAHLEVSRSQPYRIRSIPHVEDDEDHEENEDEENDARSCSCCTYKRSCKNCSIVMLYITIVLSVLLVIPISVYPTSAFIAGWATCPYRYSEGSRSICFTIATNEDTTGVDIILRETGDELIHANNTHHVQKFIDLTKIAILFSTTANGVSQLFFILALVCLFLKHYNWSREMKLSWWKKFKLYCCCTRDKQTDDKKVIPLDPFNDDYENEFIESTSIAVVYQHELEQVIILENPQAEPGPHADQQENNFFSQQDTSTSTLLQGERLGHYNTWFAIGLVMIVAISIFFLLIQYYFNEITINWLEFVATSCYALSLVRTIVSCFIFSKLMYAIQRKCEEIEMYVYYTNDNINETNDKIKKYVETIFESELKTAATEMLKFVKSSGNNIASLAEKLAGGFLKEFNENAEVKASSNQIKEAIKTRVNSPHSKYTDNTCCNNASLKKIKEYVIDGINSVDRNDIREQHYIIQDERMKIQVASYAYAMKELIKGYIKVTQDDDDGKKALALKYLRERDKHFIKTAIATLSWFQLWFLLHWLLHIISTFMIFTVLIDAVALHVKYNVPHVEHGVDFNSIQIIFLFMYSLVQGFLLVYPCLRAAGVTRTRQRVMQQISDEDKFTNLPEGVIPEFVGSMKRRKFSFRFRIMCASITFNLNIAYLSIAFGFVGIVVSLITSVTG
ncbi:PREDICTED: uncharacterized protein LOC109586380 [Amphimedon queenslandica]|uniref:Uncharacterized protein n=1 Tax=Amphimedon queenslandica TaxID=400682 RepID=A0AAN0JMT6_AMPQE|nr:PREDICTED: uncharacterized protein LOC109586380 [Amphimedon queenslandica]|eukprot:XP_019858128.1 PREDICTED: uncharacterized protein LOC109586380 [Amphimedon queenslandica]